MKSIYPILLFFLLSSFSFEAEAQRRKKGTSRDGTEYSDKFHELFFAGLRESGLNNLEKAEKAFKECLKITDQEPAVYYELSKIYWTQGNVGDALEFASKAYSLDESDEDLLQHYLNYTDAASEHQSAVEATRKYLDQLPEGSSYVQYAKKLAHYHKLARQYDAALSLYIELESTYGYANDYAFQRFQLYKATGDVKNQHLELDLLVAKNPGSAFYLYQKAHLFNSEDRLKEAQVWYNKALEVDPEHMKSLVESAQLLLSSDEKGAFERYTKVFESESADVNAKLRHYSTLRGRGINIDQQIVFAQSIQKKHEGNALANKNLYDVLKRADRPEEALPFIEKAYQLDEGDYSILFELLTTYYMNGSFERLKDVSTQGLELFPSQPGLYLYNGIASIELKSFDDAMIMLETGKTYVIGNTSLRRDFELALAELYHEMGEYDISDGIFEDLLDEKGTDFTVLNNYAYYLALRGDELKKAESMIEDCLDSDPNSPTFLDTYGWIQFKKKDYKGAVASLEKALVESPEDADILEHLGDAYAKAGNLEKASEYWKRQKSLGQILN